MYLLDSYQVVDCPICGRPLELNLDQVSHEIACGHCRGEFTVHETEGRILAATNRGGLDLLQRADELLRAAGSRKSPASEDCGQRTHSSSGMQYAVGEQDGCAPSPLEKVECDLEPLPIILLVEQRDEVFARLASDMAKYGMRVIRAKSASDALNRCASRKPALVVANVDLPDHSGWLMAAKVRFVDRHTPIWLYQTQSSNYDLGMVNFLSVEELLDYQGDLFNLAETIADLMIDWCEQRGNDNDLQDLIAA